MNSISQSFNNNPTDLNRNIPINFKDTLQLPDSHKWTLSEPVVDTLAAESIPIIDLSDPQALTLVKHACEKWGMFQITNHGVPISLINEVEEQTYRLFNLTANEKLRAARSPKGLTGYGRARISAFYSKLMWSEGFSIAGSPAEHASLLWPDDHAKFCDAMVEYQKEMKGLTERLIVLMLNSLGVSHEDEDGSISKHPETVLQLNSYPVCPDPNQAMGLAPHTDSALLTLLYQGSVGGLQVLGDNGGWVPVNPIDGGLVVNVGDLLHILSNGQFKSALHRAMVNKTRHRISVAYFYGGPKDAKVSPLRGLVDDQRPPLYRAVTWKEYLDTKAIHFTKALHFIRSDVAVDNK